ncbi:MAG: LysE family transporter [Actinomycetia bacterium]|nr:LysE family transporter [Actinomycetes bacterium]MCP4960791.1 LysE family transporter [Actinomycetes bacterium]
MFMLLLLGLGLGAITLVPPGPVSVTLVQVAVRRGRSVGFRSGAAIASADLITGVLAIAILGIGTAALPSVAASMSVVAAAAMMVMGGLLIARPVGFGGLAVGLERPARTLFALTALNPLTLLSWMAIIAAVPAANTTPRQAALAAGVTVASYSWHPFLGLVAGRAGQRINASTTVRVTRASGVVLILLGSIFALG